MASNLEIKIKLLTEGLEQIQKLKSALAEVGGSAESMATTVDDAAKAMTDLGTATGDAVSGVGDVASAASDANTSLGDIAKAAQDAATGIQDVGSAGQDAAKGLQDVGTAGEDAAAGLQDAGKAGEDAAKGIGDAGNAASAQAGKFSSLLKGLDDLGKQFDDLVRSATGVGGGLDGAGNSSSTLLGKFKTLTGGAKDVAGGTTNLAKNLTAMSGATGGGSAAVGVLTTALKPLAAGLLAIAGIKITFDYLKEAADKAARAETLGITLKVVGENAGYTQKELKTLEDQLKKTGISTTAARDGMIQMVQAGIDLGTQVGQTEPQIVKLARAAQDLAVVTGENSSETLQRLITNVSQLDTLGLRFMGIMVDVNSAQEKFATTLGTSAGALTEAQKRQAVLNEVMAQSEKLSGAYELSLESVGKKLGSMKRYVEELQISLGNKLLPAYGAIVDAGTNLLKSLGKVAEEFDKSGEVGQAFGRGVKAVLDPLVPILSRIFEWVLELGGAFAPAFEAAGEAIGAVLDVFSTLLDSVDAGFDSFGLLSGALELAEGFLKAFASGMQFVGAVINGTVSVIASLASAIAGPLADAAEAVGLDAMSKKLRGVQTDMDALAKKTGEKMGEVVDEFSKGETSVQQWWKELTTGKEELAKLDKTPAQELKDEIIKLTGEQNKNTKSSIEVAAEMGRLKTKLEEAKESGSLTEKEFAKLTSQLGQVEKKMKDELDSAFKTLKTSSAELATGISTDTGTIVGALKQISQNGLATAEQFTKAFSDKLSMAKNVQELNKFSELLNDAKTRWPEAADDLRIALGQVGVKFDEVYEKQLKSINTRQEWDRVRESIVQMGKDGALSAGEVAVAIEKGEQAVRRLEPAYISASQASQKLKAANEDVTAQLDKLNTAIQITAADAEKAYGAMATGYERLGEIVGKQANEQVSEVERRYNREKSLIDATVSNVDEAEQLKTNLVINANAEKTRILEKSSAEQLKYLDKQAEAEKGALDAKLAALDKEVAKVEEALGKQGADRKEAERRLKDLDLERQNAVSASEEKVRAKKIEVMEQIRDRYKAHIDALNAEEDRHLQRVKDIEDQKAQLKMSLEEKLRSIEKGAMGEYERYQANMTDVAEYQAKAREAFSRGEYEEGKKYLDMAKNAASELNQEVKKGDQILVDKKTAAENAKNALKQIYDTQLEGLGKEQQGHKDSAAALRQASNEKVADLQKVSAEIDKLYERSKRDTEIRISANLEQAKEKISELGSLIKDKEYLLKVKTDLDAAQAALDKLMKDIEAGKPFKVDADVAKAEETLKNLKKYAEETNNTKLAMETTEALAKIDQAKARAQSLNDLQTNQKHNVEVTGDMSKVEELKKSNGTTTSQTHDIKPGPNLELTKGEIYKIKSEDGKTYYGDYTLKTDIFEKAEKIEAVHATLGRKRELYSKHTLETDVDEKKGKIDSALAGLEGKKPKTQHTLETDAKQKDAEVQAILQNLIDRKPKTQHTLETDADKVKAEKIDPALQSKDVKSTHNLETDAPQVKSEQIDPALETTEVTSQHDVESNAEETKTGEIDPALETQEVTSQHNIESNADEVKASEIDPALQEEEVTSTHTVEAQTEEAKAEIESLNDLDTNTEHTVEAQTEDAQTEIEALNDEQTTSTHDITTDAAEAEGEIQGLQDQNTTSFHDISTDASEAAGEVGSLDGYDTSSTHDVNATDAVTTATTDIEQLDTVETESTHKVDGAAAAETAKGELETTLDSVETESTHNIDANSEEVAQEVEQALPDTQSTHTISDNAQEVGGNIDANNGRDTSSTHTVYVVKEYLFGFGGFSFGFGGYTIGSMTPPKRKNDVPRIFADGGLASYDSPTADVMHFAKGGPVARRLKQGSYPRQNSGVVPGVGNYDKVNRTLEVGSFVLKKDAVRRHGAGRLLSMIEKAKTLPKREALPAGDIPAMLMPGEIVVPKDTVSRMGSGFLSALNGDVRLPKGEMPQLPLKFADGGAVGMKVPDFMAPTIDFGPVGYAMESGGSVPAAPENVVRVDLRGDRGKASITATQDQSQNLLELLGDLRNRSL